MSLREDRQYLAEQRKAKEEAAKLARQKSINEFNQHIVEEENQKMAFNKSVDKLFEFKANVKKSLIKKMLMELCVGSIPNYTHREYSICENLIENYISEVGETTLLKNMRFSENGFLRTCWSEINSHYKTITEDATCDEDTQYIDSGSLDDFWKDVDNTEDVDDITNLIRMRVSNAEENFINRNQQDKENVKTVLKQTADRVQMAKATNDNDKITTYEIPLKLDECN